MDIFINNIKMEKRKEYQKKNIKKISKNMKGGGLSKSETLELIKNLDVCSINDIF